MIRVPFLAALASLLLPAPAASALAGDHFVNVNATTGADDGSSWADALRTPDGVARALAQAQSGDRVFVAQGTYVATLGTDRTASHDLVPGVHLVGGCDGTEVEPDDRPPLGTAITTLTGDIDGNDGSGDVSGNSHAVLRAAPGIGLDTVVDRFVVRAGNADTAGGGTGNGGGLHSSGSAPTFVDCAFVANRAQALGGAVYLEGPNAPAMFRRCRFERNRADLGAALFAQDALNVGVVDGWFLANEAGLGGTVVASGGTLLNLSQAVLQGNEGLAFGCAHSQGGGIVRLYSCTVVGNSITQAGHAAASHGGTGVVLKNTLVWGNPAGPGGDTGTPVQAGCSVSFCLVEGGYIGGLTLDGDPRLRDPAGGDLRPGPGSPAIDSGNENFLGSLTTDLQGLPRQVDDPLRPDLGIGSPVPDIGAFEAAWPSAGAPDVGCVPLANSTGVPAVLGAQGSPLLADGDLWLGVQALPPGEFGVFLMAEPTANLVTPGGVLCLGFPFYRFADRIQLSDGFGTAGLALDPTNLPQGQTFLPGSTWHFQYWYRDGLGANLSGAIGLTWQ